MNIATRFAALVNRSDRDYGEPILAPGLILRASLVGALLLVVASWVFVIGFEGIRWGDLLSRANFELALEFLGDLAGTDVENPAYTSAERWTNAFHLTIQTLKMSILAIGLAGLAMLVTVFFGARSTAEGKITLRSSLPGKVLYGVIRLLYVFSRSVPELFWAMLIIFVFEPGVLPGALALAVHNFGILGKLCSEIVEDLDVRPTRALRSSGAGPYQILVYGILPEVTPKFLTYLLYRWEAVIRATIVVGFVSAGGLGREFKLSMNWFHYTEVTLFLICYLGLVIGVDLVSGSLRKLAKA